MNQAVPFSYAAHVEIEIGGRPYRGVHTRRAIKSAMTRAGVSVCWIRQGGTDGDGAPMKAQMYWAADLAHLRHLG
jgi:hypothetical protein